MKREAVCVCVCVVSSQITGASTAADQQRTTDRTQDSPSDRRQHLPDDEDGHLLYSEGTVLNHRCKRHATLILILTH